MMKLALVAFATLVSTSLAQGNATTVAPTVSASATVTALITVGPFPDLQTAVDFAAKTCPAAAAAACAQAQLPSYYCTCTSSTSSTRRRLESRQLQTTYTATLSITVSIPSDGSVSIATVTAIFTGDASQRQIQDAVLAAAREQFRPEVLAALQFTVSTPTVLLLTTPCPTETPCDDSEDAAGPFDGSQRLFSTGALDFGGNRYVAPLGAAALLVTVAGMFAVMLRRIRSTTSTGDDHALLEDADAAPVPEC